MVVAFFITDFVIYLITEPIRQIAEREGEAAKVELMFSTVTGAFDLRLRMSFAIGILISAPIWLWQIWAFIMPGLTRKEIKYTIGFVAAAVPLFFAGCWVGLIVMPHIVELMAGFVPDGGASFFDASYYYDFVFKLLIVVGISFVLPVFLVALNLAGVMSGKAILKGWRVAVLVAVAFSALATPAAGASTRASVCSRRAPTWSRSCSICSRTGCWASMIRRRRPSSSGTSFRRACSAWSSGTRSRTACRTCTST